MRDIEISTTRTTIRPFKPEDASEVFACISPEITRFMAWKPPPPEAIAPMHGALGFPLLKRGLSYILSPVIGTMDDSWHRRSTCPSVQNAPLAPIWPPAERATTARTIPPSACLSRNTRTDAANWQGLRKPMIPPPVGGLSFWRKFQRQIKVHFGFGKSIARPVAWITQTNHQCR